MKKTLLLLVTLLFFIGCEDNNGDEGEDHNYIELKSFSWKPFGTWYSHVVEGYEPPINHSVVRECQWLRLYREYKLCECLLSDNIDGTGGTVYVMDLFEIEVGEYEYVEM